MLIVFFGFIFLVPFLPEAALCTITLVQSLPVTRGIVGVTLPHETTRFICVKTCACVRVCVYKPVKIFKDAQQFCFFFLLTTLKKGESFLLMPVYLTYCCCSRTFWAVARNSDAVNVHMQVTPHLLDHTPLFFFFLKLQPFPKLLT